MAECDATALRRVEAETWCPVAVADQGIYLDKLNNDVLLTLIDMVELLSMPQQATSMLERKDVYRRPLRSLSLVNKHMRMLCCWKLFRYVHITSPEEIMYRDLWHSRESRHVWQAVR